jgi:hypothetical protein
MSEHHQKQCIVLLPSGPQFELLFREVLEIAIRNIGLIPSRLLWNPLSPTPIHLFVDEIEQAEAVVADTSEHTEEIWLAVGCAVALGKPLCLISSAPERANVPLGIQYLPHISYPVEALPRDYIELQKKIYAQLTAIMPRLETPHSELSHQHQYPAPPSSSTSPSSEDLASYEVMALTILDLKGANSGLSPRDLGLEMRACNAAPLTSHAMNALKRRRFIETKPVQIGEGNELYLSENLFLTRAGEDWLSRHGKRATAQRTPLRARARFVSTR